MHAVCQLCTEDRLKIEKLKQGWSLNHALRYIQDELGYYHILRSSLYTHKKHMDKVNPPHYRKPKKRVWKAKHKGKLHGTISFRLKIQNQTHGFGNSPH